MWKHYITCFYISIVIKYVRSCQCNLNHTELNKEKRQLESEEYSATEFIDNTIAPENETTVDVSTSTYRYKTTFVEAPESTTAQYESIIRIFDVEANKSQILEEDTTVDNIFDLPDNISEPMDPLVNSGLKKYDEDYDSSDNETSNENISDAGKQVNSDLEKKCKFFKKGDNFKLNKLAGVWQVVYYRLPNKMKCFKINIKVVNEQDQQRLGRVYGSFNDTVQWDHCFLEITSPETDNKGRRHFLQGVEGDRGVMANVIIDEEYTKNTTYLTLHSEGGDQWLVIRNILLMRDCDNGDYVVFTRYPKQPRRAVVMDALKKFGETQPKGTIACDMEKIWQKYEEEKNDNHLVRTREYRHHNKNITAGVNYHNS